MEFRKIISFLAILIVVACVMGLITIATTGAMAIWTLVLADVITIALAAVIFIQNYLQ